jgi:hypothetical protein
MTGVGRPIKCRKVNVKSAQVRNLVWTSTQLLWIAHKSSEICERSGLRLRLWARDSQPISHPDQLGQGTSSHAP